MVTSKEPEIDDIFLYRFNIWTFCLQVGDFYTEVLHLLPSPRKWTHLWGDLCSYVLVRKEQLIRRGYACSQSKAKRDMWKDTLLSLVSFTLDLIIHYHLLHPNTASNTVICFPVFFLVDLSDKYNYAFPCGFRKFLLNTDLTDIQMVYSNVIVCLVTHEAAVSHMWTSGLIYAANSCII